MKLPGTNQITLHADAVKMMIESELNNGTRDKRHRIRITDMHSNGYDGGMKLDITTDLDPKYVEPTKQDTDPTLGAVVPERALPQAQRQGTDPRFPL